jgi:hypothetical protein
MNTETETIAEKLKRLGLPPDFLNLTPEQRKLWLEAKAADLRAEAAHDAAHADALEAEETLERFPNRGINAASA